MSRSNYDKPFYVDVGTSIVAVRCASNHDVIVRYDHVRHSYALDLAKDVCDRMNKEVEIGKPRRNCDRFSTLYDAVVAWGREDQNWDDWPDEDAEDENDLLNILTGDQIHELVDWLFAPATEQKG